VLLRNNWLKEYEINEQISFYNGNDYWDKDGSFSFTRFKEEKRKEFHELIHYLNQVKYQKYKNSIQEIELFIRKNYEKDITLQDIADRFYLSREYISRKFKQEYHETITNYLTKIRIEKAKELLENPHLKIYEVSFKVGYQNEKYFSKVFKKMVGLTPNEYRLSVMTK
jgi:two-component system response regulator YesN